MMTENRNVSRPPPNITSDNVANEADDQLSHHQCKVCDKIFESDVDLKEHVRIRGGQKIHQCQFCERQFHRPSICRLHENTHYGLKPHQCEICGFSQFRQPRKT